MLVSETIPNLINGVSQQAYALRRPSQGESQENFLSSVVDGLKRRPPSHHVAKLSATDYSAAKQHLINRDPTERYSVLLVDQDLKVFDLDGNEITVAFPNGKTYLDCTDPQTDLRAVTVADYTFIVNTTVTAAMGSTTSDTLGNEALVNVKQGNYGKGYRIIIDGTVRAEYLTPDGGSSSHSEDIDTVNIATELYNDLVGVLGAGWTVTRYQSALHIVNAVSDFSIAVEDGFNGNAMIAHKNGVQDFQDLPNFGPEGFTIEISGDANSAFDNYWVKFEKENTGDSSGIWKETLAPGIKTSFDAATMPHVLVRESNGTFTFRQAEWDTRLVGDAESAPEPSFIGNTISDIFFYRNRVGILASENVVFSAASDFFRFWPKTVTTLLDSDPIDVAASHTKVSILRHAIPFHKRLILFSEQTQFELSAQQLLTPTTVSIDATTEFPCSPVAKPVLAGQNIFFAADRGNYSSVREYFIDENNETNDAADISAHVPEYIPKGVFEISSSSNEDAALFLSSLERNTVVVYKYYWDAREKLQSSWSKFTFRSDAKILSADFVDDDIYMVVAYPDGTFLEYIPVSQGQSDPSSEFLFCMDRKVYETDLSLSYDGTYTTITLPYEDTSSFWIVIRSGNTTGGLREGYSIPVFDQPSNSTLRVEGDYTGAKFCVGTKYTSSYEFSPFLIREGTSQGGSTTVGEGRLQILRMNLLFEDTGYFKIQVTPQSGILTEHIFPGKVLGSPQTKIGYASVEQRGRFRFPVNTRNTAAKILIVSDHFLPCAIMQAEWEGMFHLRSRRRSGG